MSGLSAGEIEHLAKLSRIELSQEEKEHFAQELPKIAEFVEALQDAKIEPMDNAEQAVELESLRPDDKAKIGLSLEQLKKLAPQWQKNQVVVPAVFGEAHDA